MMYGVPNIRSYPAGDETMFDGLTDDDSPTYKIAVYEWSNGGWVPTEVMVITGEDDDEDDMGHPDGCRCDFCEDTYEHPMGCRCHKCSGFVPFAMQGVMDDGDDDEYGEAGEYGEAEDDDEYGNSMMAGMDDYDPMSSPLYGKAVMMASARRDTEAKRASLVYRSVVPLSLESEDPHVAAIGLRRMGRQLTPAEIEQRRRAARAPRRKRGQMRLKQSSMLEDRRRALREQEQKMKQQRKIARQSLKEERKKTPWIREAGRAFKKALKHEVKAPMELFFGESELAQRKPRRAGLSAVRMAHIAALAERDRP